MILGSKIVLFQLEILCVTLNTSELQTLAIDINIGPTMDLGITLLIFP